MAGYIGTQAVSVNTTSATISDDLSVGDDLTVTDDATIGGTLGVTGKITANAGIDIDNFNIDGTSISHTAAMTINAADVRIKNVANDETMAQFDDDGAVTLYHNNVPCLSTATSGSVTIADNLSLTSDSARLNIGAGNDLKLIHDGTNGTFESAGNLTVDVVGDIELNADGGQLYIKDGNTNIATFENSANALLLTDGNLKIGTAGHGIDFHNFGTGTNIDNNLLDDYEEGTWSPTMLQGSNAPAAYAQRTGYYTKVGNLVHLNGRVQLNGLGSMSGTIFMTGLPFTATDATNNFSAFHVGYYAGFALPTATATMMGIVNPNSINVDLRLGNDVADSSSLTAAHVSADGDFIFSMTYKA